MIQQWVYDPSTKTFALYDDYRAEVEQATKEQAYRSINGGA